MHGIPKMQATLLKRILKDDLNIDVGHSKCLHIISILYGYKNWQTLNGMLDKDKEGKLKKKIIESLNITNEE